MSLPISETEPTAELPPDEAAALLWQIARRADRLVRKNQRGPGLNRECWLIAEREVAGHIPEAARILSHENRHPF